MQADVIKPHAESQRARRVFNFRSLYFFELLLGHPAGTTLLLKPKILCEPSAALREIINIVLKQILGVRFICRFGRKQ